MMTSRVPCSAGEQGRGLLQGTVEVLVCLCFVLSAILLPSRLAAQFLYLDTNGDARSSSEDVLDAVGVPTMVTIYLDTSRNPDSSVAYCTTGPEPLPIASYKIILHATGGTVTFGDYTNARPTMGTPFGAGSNATDFYAGFGGSTILPPGLYQLGALSVTVVTGSPTLNPATATPLSAHFGTTFGTQCVGHDEDNTYKLGLDWHGTAGCGPPGGGDAAPAATAPSRVDLAVAEPADFTAEFSDPSELDSLITNVQGLPPGLTSVQGPQAGGRSQIRVYGILDPAVQPGSAFQVVWSVTDGSAAESMRTDVRVIDSGPPPPDFEERVVNFVTLHYHHGMPRYQVRELGTRALPILARMLNDGSYRRHWHKVAAGIGFIGDISYFDTLRAYIWSRFGGPVDQDTYMAILSAQVSLSAMATVSPRVLGYLEETSDPVAWQSLAWSVEGHSREYISQLMANESVIALGYTDSRRAGEILLRLLRSPSNSARAALIRGALRVNGWVRAKGYLRVWAEQDPSPAPEGRQ